MRLNKAYEAEKNQTFGAAWPEMNLLQNSEDGVIKFTGNKKKR
jgi:hypothetical protein